MKLVIDIPQEVKEAFNKASKDDINFCFYDYNSVIGKAIKYGAPYGAPLDDVRQEIEHVIDNTYDSTDYDTSLYNGAYKDGLYEALDIIDCHIGERKEDDCN